MPCSLIDAVSSSSADWSKVIRGWSGLASMRLTGTWRTPRLRVEPSGDSRLITAGPSSRSSDRRRAAVARKSVLAKFDHLPRQLTIGPGRVGARCVRRNWPSRERSLTQLDRIPNDRVEDVVLVEHLAAEDRAAVVERGQQAEDAQVAIQLGPDRVDHLDQGGQALERVVLRLDRNDHAVCRDKRIDRQQPERRRAVDQGKVIVLV